MIPIKLEFDKQTANQIRAEIFRPLALGFIIGLGVASIPAAMTAAALGYTYRDGKSTFELTKSEAWIISLIFIGIAATVSVIAYYKTREDRQNLIDDIYTPFRKQLAGTWQIFWTDKIYDNVQRKAMLRDDVSTDICNIGIDVAGKLYLEIEVKNHPIMENWSKRIEDISMNLQKKRICYFDESKFTLRSSALGDDIANKSFKARFFVMLEATEIDEDGKIAKFDGSWYDLDGQFAEFKSVIARRLHDDLPEDAHFPNFGVIEFVRAPYRPAAILEK